jgi:hypothetical protein
MAGRKFCTLMGTWRGILLVGGLRLLQLNVVFWRRGLGAVSAGAVRSVGRKEE